MANLSDYLPTAPVAPDSPWETVADGIAYNDGNVGIGGTQAYKLYVEEASPTNGIVQSIGATGSTGAQINFYQAGVSNWAMGQPAGEDDFAFWSGRTAVAAGTESMRIDADGNVDLYAEKNLRWRWQPNDYIRGQISVSNASNMIFTTAYNEAMRLDASGNLTATGNVTAYSDERLKSDVETLDGSKVYDMRGVSFTKDGEAGSGVIAQELQKVAPELVHEGEEYLSVAYGNLVGYLIEAVKDLKAEVEELKRAK